MFVGQLLALLLPGEPRPHIEGLSGSGPGELGGLCRAFSPLCSGGSPSLGSLSVAVEPSLPSGVRVQDKSSRTGSGRGSELWLSSGALGPQPVLWAQGEAPVDRGGWAGGLLSATGSCWGGLVERTSEGLLPTRASPLLTADPGGGKGLRACAGPLGLRHTCQQRGGQSGPAIRGGWRWPAGTGAGPPRLPCTASGHPCPRQPGHGRALLTWSLPPCSRAASSLQSSYPG